MCYVKVGVTHLFSVHRSSHLSMSRHNVASASFQLHSLHQDKAGLHVLQEANEESSRALPCWTLHSSAHGAERYAAVDVIHWMESCVCHFRRMVVSLPRSRKGPVGWVNRCVVPCVVPAAAVTVNKQLRQYTRQD